ncbi:hypothetical protein [Paenibacillus alkalitolerans]|uniref:hypothetical protein n=1 Tax=Paenibacillus alkalitolerans TaxID=2799335 RepID=UPI0018F4A0EE|nr:hypothetical protein [Paenibacillus alkalitolerans]
MKKENSSKASFWKDNSGDFGIRQIAATVAVIVIIGFIVTAIQTNIGSWVNEVWRLFIDQIENTLT